MTCRDIIHLSVVHGAWLCSGSWVAVAQQSHLWLWTYHSRRSVVQDSSKYSRVQENGTLDFHCVLEIMEYAPAYVLKIS
jgi:hypothetical protein